MVKYGKCRYTIPYMDAMGYVFSPNFVTRRIHVTGIFVYIYRRCMVNVGKYSTHGASGSEIFIYIDGWKMNPF